MPNHDYNDTDHDADEHAYHDRDAISMMMSIPLHMLTPWEGDLRKAQNKVRIRNWRRAEKRTADVKLVKTANA